MAYFGCDQSQVQRYLSGRTLTESRLSLLFNAFLKVPMQFLILLTGVLVFVFFHFHPTPAPVGPAELARVETRADAADLARVRAEAEAAHRERRAAAEGFAAARREGGDVVASRDAYLAAQRRLGAAEADARGLAEAVMRRPVNDVNHIFPSYVVSQLRGGLAGLVIAVISPRRCRRSPPSSTHSRRPRWWTSTKRFLRPDGTARTTCSSPAPSPPSGASLLSSSPCGPASSAGRPSRR